MSQQMCQVLHFADRGWTYVRKSARTSSWSDRPPDGLSCASYLRSVTYFHIQDMICQKPKILTILLCIIEWCLTYTGCRRSLHQWRNHAEWICNKLWCQELLYLVDLVMSDVWLTLIGINYKSNINLYFHHQVNYVHMLCLTSPSHFFGLLLEDDEWHIWAVQPLTTSKHKRLVHEHSV